MGLFAKNLPPSGIRTVFDRVAAMEREGRRILRLDIGRPDWKMPPGAADGAKKALDHGYVHYIANRGLPELRTAVAADIHKLSGRAFDPDTEIIVTTGASEGLAMAALALLGPGDEMIVPEPAWPHYKAAAALAGAKAIPVPLRAEDGFLLDPERLEQNRSRNTKMLVLNNPCNPTGAVQPGEVLRETAKWAEKHGILVLADEVYQDFVHQGEFTSLASIMPDSDLLIVLNSLSKSCAMTGWRIGYAAACARVSDALNRVHQYLTVCGVSFAQKGAAAVFQNPGRSRYLQEMRNEFKLRYQVWKQAFTNHPNLRMIPPGGAFYLFPRIEFKGMCDYEFCEHALREHKVAMIPGSVFGEDYAKFVRISYARNIAVQKEAVDRLLRIFTQ